MQCDGGLNRIAYDPHHFLPAVNGGFLPPLSPVPAPIAGWSNQKQERRREELFFFLPCVSTSQSQSLLSFAEFSHMCEHFGVSCRFTAALKEVSLPSVNNNKGSTEYLSRGAHRIAPFFLAAAFHVLVFFRESSTCSKRESNRVEPLHRRIRYSVSFPPLSANSGGFAALFIIEEREKEPTFSYWPLTDRNCPGICPIRKSWLP